MNKNEMQPDRQSRYFTGVPISVLDTIANPSRADVVE